MLNYYIIFYYLIIILYNIFLLFNDIFVQKIFCLLSNKIIFQNIGQLND